MPADPGLSPPLSDPLAELRRLRDAATQGPVVIGDGGTDYEPCLETAEPWPRTYVICRNLTPADAAYLEALWNAADTLLSALSARLSELQAAAGEAAPILERLLDAENSRYLATYIGDGEPVPLEIRSTPYRHARDVLARLRSAAGEGKGGRT